MSVAVETIYETLDDKTRDLLRLRARGGTVRGRGWLVRRALVAADFAGLTSAFAVAHLLYNHGPGGEGALSGTLEIAVFAASLPLWVVGAKLYGLYDRDEERADHSTTDDFIGVFHLVTVCTFLLYACSRKTSVFNPEFGKLLLFWLLAVPGVTAARATARCFCRGRINYVQNTIIVGAGEVGQMVAEKILRHPEYGLNLVGFVDADPRPRRHVLQHVSVLGSQLHLAELVEALDVERVIVAFTAGRHEESLTLLRQLGSLDVQIDIVPRLFEAVGAAVSIQTVEGMPLVSLPPLNLSRSSLLLKRTTDLVIASVALLLTLPVLMLCALAIRVDSRGSAVFVSRRVGRGGAEFGLLKFRTMRVDADDLLDELLNDPRIRQEFEESHKLSDDPRITRLGRFLRKSSLDELPQLINVLTGDLSIVGPRPITLYELDLVAGTDVADLGYWELSNFRPGITGYWQINGRSSIGYRERVRLDLAYLTGWSLSLDVNIVVRTLRVLVSRGGAL